MRCISWTSKYWAAIFKGTNDHVTSTALKNQKLSKKKGFKNLEKYEDGGIPCILPGSEIQTKYQPKKQARGYARSEVKGLIDTFSTLYKRKDRTVCAVSTVCL